MLSPNKHATIAIVCYAFVSAWLPQAVAAEPVATTLKFDFKTDIRPILSNRCFACHGPDEGHVESGLRLHEFELATAPADSGSVAIQPGNVQESELIRRVSSTDPSERMPPPHFGAALTERETELMKAWIASGAKYSKHWSFDRIQPPILEARPVPDSLPNWQQSAIDSLLIKKLTELSWKPSPEADRRTLLRRLTLDLTGLPPTLEQQFSFETNSSEQAYENLVDELLASPALGEHWGRKWLDLARYADSAGYADDPQRTIWAYRDWVIQAINAGMPFDQFTIEQLAGDLLPNATDEQLVATAFHRNTLTNNEGGTNDEEFRNVAVVDRVNTTMAVWMGVTIACAQCHSHKFDPITHAEYFQIFDILNQTQDADRADESPVFPWFTPEQRRDRSQKQKQIAALESQLSSPAPTLNEEQRIWAERLHSPIDWQTVKPTNVRSKAKSPAAIADNGDIKIDAMSDSDTYTIELPIPDHLDLDALSGLQIRSIPDPSLPNGGAAIGNGNFVLTTLSALVTTPASHSVTGRFIRVELQGENKILSLAEVQAFAGDENLAKGGKASQSSTAHAGNAELAIDGKTSGVYTDNSTTHTETSNSPWWELDLGKPIAIEKILVSNRTDPETSHRLEDALVSILNDDRTLAWQSTIGKAKANHTLNVQPSVLVPIQVANADYAQEGFPAGNAIDSDAKSGWSVGGEIDKAHQLSIAFHREKFQEALTAAKLDGPKTLKLSLRFESSYRKAVLTSFSIAFTVDERLDAIVKVPARIAQLLERDPERWLVQEQTELHAYYVSTLAPSRQSLREERDQLAARLAEIKATTTVPVLRELPSEKRRSTHIQLRGNYKVHGELVSAGVPKAFHPWKQDKVDAKDPKMDRLQFAQWLMQPDNPLTARVIANRYWETLFGLGIVRTSEEFGSQGDLPSHPELLDYLASELIRIDWDTKRFIRSIVTSAAYRQQSSVTAKRYEEDPDNVYLSRGPRLRVTAEQVRDMALSSAGLLSQRLHGPPAKPPQPSLGLTAAFGSKTDWDTSLGEERFRRGIYTLWRRSNPYPSMATFDAPNREVCVLKRDRTNTPLQALVTLNDPVYVEAAQALARRVVVHELPQASAEQRIHQIFGHALSRKPFPRETDALLRLYEETFHEMKMNLDRAAKLATDPIGPIPVGSDPAELAAWTTVCNVLLNLDEFLMTP